ncbi:MAG: hypothetical protein FWF96_03130 [Kiritimatiellaeota bacterium]|nr:hypothetical protein [Kiritimatiellota bacterium]
MTNTTKRTTHRALIIEVDTAMLHGISRSLAPLQALLKSNGLELGQWEFLQKVVGVSPERLPDILFAPGGKPGLSEAIRTTVQGVLPEGLPGFVEKIAAILAKAAPKNVRVVLVSALPDVKLKEVLGDALKDQVTVLQVTRSHSFVFKPEMWRMICARAGLHERFCVGVAGSGISCRSALAAGLHAVAAYDPLMEGNDYGGANHVSAALDAKLVDEALRCLRV